MAGVKGRSGGPRQNSGGKRVGAGRKPKVRPDESANTKDPLPAERKDPLAFLEDVVNDTNAPLKDRIRAAVAAAQYRHTKRGDGGKRDEIVERAQKIARGRFGAAAPPKLVVSNL